MKNILTFLVIVFIAHCVTSAYSAEPSAASKSATISNQPPEAVSQTLQEKIGQVRAVLTEIQNLLKQEEKILAKTQEQKKKTKETDASLSDYNRASDGMKHDIQQLRKQVEETEKEFEAYTRQNERFSRLQVELAKAQKERQDSENQARQAEVKLVAAQKNLDELNNRFAELTKQTNEAKQQSQNLENAKALLETERTKRVEALSRAEKAVATAEKAEKERLLLASRLAELEQNLSPQEKQQKESPEQGDIQGEIEKEKKAIQETEEKIRKDETAREEAENKILELKKQLRARGKTERGGEKEGELNSLKGKLAGARKQRVAAESRMKEAEGKLRNSERSVEALTNTLAAVENQIQQDSEATGLSARARIQSGIENEQQALSEIRNTIAQKEKACWETEKNIAELRQKLKEVEKNTRNGAGKEGDLSRLQSRLANVKKQRAEAEERLKESEGSMRESEKIIAGLTNMIAAARMQEENNKESAKAFDPLMGELERETALVNEVTARVDRQIRNLKALEDDKRRLSESLILVKEKLDKEGENTNKLDEIRLQIAGQKKIRTDMETKLEQTTRDQLALEKETKELNQALIVAGNVILNKENESKAAERVTDELRVEKELARNADKLLREKEQNVKRLGEDKEALQIKLKEAEVDLTQQKERIKDMEAKQRALEEEKMNRKTSGKKYAELVQAEKEHKAQIKKLENKASAADEEIKRLSSQADKTSSEIEAGQTSAVGVSDTKETQNVQTAAGSSGRDTMAVEQAVLNQARVGDSQPSEQPEKKERQESKQTKSRSRQNKIAEAEEHYALAIQKWDGDDLDGAIEEFKKAASLNPDAAGAYYNLSLAFLRQGKKKEACEYAYMAGECYVRINNLMQATRMTVLMTKIDKDSRLIQKLRNKIDAATR